MQQQASDQSFLVPGKPMTRSDTKGGSKFTIQACTNGSFLPPISPGASTKSTSQTPGGVSRGSYSPMT